MSGVAVIVYLYFYYKNEHTLHSALKPLQMTHWTLFKFVLLFWSWRWTSGLHCHPLLQLDAAPAKARVSFLQRFFITGAPVELVAPSLQTWKLHIYLKNAQRSQKENGKQLLKSPVLQAKPRDPLAGGRLGGDCCVPAPPGTRQRRSACAQELPRKVTLPRRSVCPSHDFIKTW